MVLLYQSLELLKVQLDEILLLQHFEKLLQDRQEVGAETRKVNVLWTDTLHSLWVLPCQLLVYPSQALLLLCNNSL